MACQNNCCCSHSHHHDDHNHNHNSSKKEIIIVSVAFVMLFTKTVMDFIGLPFFQSQIIYLLWHLIPLIFVGFPVFKEAILLILKKDLFNELTLMSFATLGAFIIGDYAEGLGVMVFYTIGELFQHNAVNKSRSNIKALLDVRPDIAHVVRGNNVETIKPQDVVIGDIIEVYSGEKVPLDGVLSNEKAFFNTSALTGESVPRNIKQNEEVLAGMLSSGQTIRLEVTKTYENSTLSRILKMVEDASENKSPTEQFIRKFARVYTPIVFGLAVLLVVTPFFVLGSEYYFIDWFYRSLTFLVISCPCAFVISVPLGYFGGIGLASRYGILFKGSNYLDALTHLKTLVTDKTGTMTKGEFTIQEIVADNKDELLLYLVSLESHSTHPIAKAIVEYTNLPSPIKLENVTEIAGYGLSGEYQGKTLLAGNQKLMTKYNITLDKDFSSYVDTLVFAAYDDKFLGYVVVADSIKEDSPIAVQQLHDSNINVVMLSGDKQEIVDSIAKTLDIDEAHGGLLPDGKALFVQQLKQQNNGLIAFVGDGINDAPVLALSDIGIAMGGLGSDLAIETADIIIQNDEPSKIPLAIKISHKTRQIVLQNIICAMGVKVIVLILGAMGMVSMWLAIFADVGVAMLAILNASRLLWDFVPFHRPS